jgi:hypothetical protein
MIKCFEIPWGERQCAGCAQGVRRGVRRPAQGAQGSAQGVRRACAGVRRMVRRALHRLHRRNRSGPPFGVDGEIYRKKNTPEIGT